MWRTLLTVSLVPIILVIVVRWWFALRVLAADGRRLCRCDLTRWQPASSDAGRSDLTAAKFGLDLRETALADWKAADPKGFASRQNTHRFALAAPPLSGIVAIFAVVVGKIPVAGALSIPLAFTALAAVFAVLGLPAELAAIQRTIRRIKDERWFPDRDDEEAVCRAAHAWAWEHSMPPILRWLQKKSA